jgi:hypothetical protein
MQVFRELLFRQQGAGGGTHLSLIPVAARWPENHS